MRESCASYEAASNAAGAMDCTQNIRGEERRKFFRDLTEFLWPEKTAWVLADRTGRKLRVVRYWMSGECEIPAIAEREVYLEIMRRLS